MILNRRHALLLGLSVLPAGAFAAAGGNYPQISFTSQPAFTFNAGRFEVVNQFNPPPGPPHIENDVPVSPAFAIDRWGRDRLRVNGAGPALVRLIIEEASATQTALAKDESFVARWSKQQTVRYDIIMKVTVAVSGTANGASGSVTGSAMRANTIGEEASIGKRDDALFQLVDQCVHDLDAQMDAAIKQHLAQFLA